MNSDVTFPLSSKTTPDRLNAICLYTFAGLTVVAYFLNLGLNNIWTPNESFYDESVREMIESGNYLDIFYNYEPRFNKPPLVYWLMAASALLFGLSEFAIRLPIALAGLGTIFLVYRTGKLLEGQRLGIVAAMVMAFSFQFVINARYGAPAIPLTFLFTWTMYLFLKGYQHKQFSYILLAYLALGLTILMKGYPYLIIISLIIGVYLFFDSRFSFKTFWAKIVFLRPWLGLPLALAIGMSWISYMYIAYGDAFHEVFMEETYRRAFTRKTSLKPFFYLEANLWGFLPYALTLYLGLIYLIVNRFRNFLQQPVLKLGFSWFIVMLIVFTIAKGKIPTYFIQAHPGMSLLTAYFILYFTPASAKWKPLYNLQFWLPGILFLVLNRIIVYMFEGHFLFHLLAISPVLLLLLAHYEKIEWLSLPYLPFYSLLSTYLLFAMLVLPKMESGYRNQDLMGQAVKEKITDRSIPIMIETIQVHNLPFYAERRVVPYLSPQQIEQTFLNGKGLALVPLTHAHFYKDTEEVWRGLVYSGSESRTLEFILEIFKHKRGELSKFSEYVVLYKEK